MQHKPAERDWDELKKLGYEPENIKMKGLAVSGVLFFVFVALNLVAAAWLLKVLNKDAFNAPTASMAFSKKSPPPPNPLLQTNVTTKVDIKELRLDERAKLEGYANIDEGHIRIPIDRAMEVSLEKGLSPGKPSSSVVTHGGK